MRRHQDHGPPAVARCQASGKIQAALPRKGNVHENGIRPELLGSPKRFRRRRGNPCDIEALELEEAARSIEERRVVIHDQDARRHSVTFARAARAPQYG
jgi:hypothetical protein